MTRQAKFNKRQREIRRTLGLCQHCGQKKPCGNQYCGYANKDRVRERQKLLMRARRAAGRA